MRESTRGINPNILLSNGIGLAQEVLSEIGVSCEVVDFVNPNSIKAETDCGCKFTIYISPFGKRYYFENCSGPRYLRSSRHYVLFVFPQTTKEEIAGRLEEYVGGLRRGRESENIAAKALKIGLRDRSDLFADAYKTEAYSDMEGADFRLGIHHPRHGVIFIGLQIKSSSLARIKTIERWGQDKRDRVEVPIGALLRRVVSVPRGGSEEERIAETLRRIIQQVETVLGRRPLRV